MKKMIAVVLVLCTVLSFYGVCASAAECPHRYEEIVIAPSCTEDGFLRYACALCGDSYKVNADEADRWSPWYQPLRDVEYHFDSGKNVNRSNISVFCTIFFADHLAQTFGHDAESAFLKDPEHTYVEIGELRLCLNDIKEGRVSYELALAAETDGGYVYRIRFNDRDLHAKGHDIATRTENERFDADGNLCCWELVSYCKACGRVLDREIRREPIVAPPIESDDLAPLGDVDLDLEVTVADAKEVLRYSVGLPCRIFNKGNADVNADGVIDVNDARLILRRAVGLE